MTGLEPRRSLKAPARTRSSREATAPGSHHLLKAPGDGSGRAAVLSILGGHSGRVDLAARDELGRTALQLAAARGDCVLVGHLLEAGADAEAKAADGSTALLMASLHGDLEVVDALLSSGRCGDLEARDRHGRTALYCAVLGGHSSVVRRLLEAGAKADVKAASDLTALFVASRDDHLDVVDVLLSSYWCGDLEARNTRGHTALYCAAMKGHSSVVRRLLEAGADADVKAVSGLTALLVASRDDHLEVVDALLSSGRCGDLEARNKHGWTALYCAVLGGHASVVRRLLEAGANAEAKAASDLTALFVASRADHLEVVDVLLSSDWCGDLEARDKHGHTALYCAAMRGHASVVRRLLEAGADADVKAADGSTALLAASRGGHVDVVDALLSSGRCADLEARNTRGRTPLYCAAWKGHVDVVGRLLEVGADGEARAANASTVLLVASLYGHVDVVDALLSSGRCGDLEVCDKRGRTALHRAAWRGRASVVGRLLEAGADAEARTWDHDYVLEDASPSVRPLIQAAVDAGPARRMANLRWHRQGRRRLVMWRRAAHTSGVVLSLL